MDKGWSSGVFWAASSALFFSAATLAVKGLGPDVPYYWVAFMRNAASIPLLVLLMDGRGVRFSSPDWPRLLLRGLWGALAVACVFWALPRMPVSNAIALAHASPLYAALWGTLFLGETMGARSAGFLLLAFAGVCVALKPQLSFSALPYFAAFASGIFSSFSHAAVKSLTSREPATRIVLYAALAGALFFLPQVAASDFRPAPAQWAVMAGVGFSAAVAQLLLTRGISRAPVSRASGGVLMTVVANVAGAWLLWGEAPDAWGWGGCALVTAGLLGLSRDGRSLSGAGRHLAQDEG